MTSKGMKGVGDLGRSQRLTRPMCSSKEPCPRSRIGGCSEQADICSYLTRISHQWLRKMVAHRIATLLFVAISFTLLGLWAARALTAPLSSFASAAESFSLNGAAAPLPERGPEEIRSVAKALNRMRERITILIDDRTRMLAAISTT
jgi:HAMP domain-containing protein